MEFHPVYFTQVLFVMKGNHLKNDPVGQPVSLSATQTNVISNDELQIITIEKNVVETVTVF